MNRPLLGFLLALVGIGAAQAQQTNTFIPSGNYTSLTAGATSTNIALPANSPAIQLENTGATAVSCSFGMSSADAVATPLQLIVQPGGQKTVGVPQGMTWVACVDQTGSASNVVIVAGGNGSGSDVGSNVITTIPSGIQDTNLAKVGGSAVAPGQVPVVGAGTTGSASVGAPLLLGYQNNSGNLTLVTPTATGLPVQGCSSCQAIGVTAAQSGTWTVGLSAGGANVGGVELIDSAGTNKATISAGGAVKVDGSAVTQPVSGSITSTPLALTPVTASTALESNHVLKGSGGTFYGVQANTTSAGEWVMLLNATSLPSNGAVTPIAWWQVPINTTLSISESPAFTMSTGIVIACSTTGPFTLTASALCTFAGGVVQ